MDGGWWWAGSYTPDALRARLLQDYQEAERAARAEEAEAIYQEWARRFVGSIGAKPIELNEFSDWMRARHLKRDGLPDRIYAEAAAGNSWLVEARLRQIVREERQWTSTHDDRVRAIVREEIARDRT